MDSAFTLIELLVVVVVMLALAAILVPTLAHALAHARAAACRSNLRHLALAALNYAADHGGHLVPFSEFARNTPNKSGSRGVNVRWSWSDDTPGDPRQALQNGLLAPYLNYAIDVGRCPAFHTPDRIRDFYENQNLAYPVDVHYGYNGLLLSERHGNFYGSDPNAEGYRCWIGLLASRVRNPPSTVMFADSADLMMGQLIPTPTLCPPLPVYAKDGSLRAKPLPSFHGRHPGGRANVAWVDGHVSSEMVQAPDENRLGFLYPPDENRNNSWMSAE